MPSLDFYAVGVDHTAVLDAAFELGLFRVFEAYSEPDEESREFTMSGQVPTTRAPLLALHVVGAGPEPVARRIDLRPGQVLGDAAFGYRCDGWGLIQLERWDWTLISRTSNKLNRLIRGMAVRKIGPWPVLPEAARLIADAGLRYVYGLGVHTRPSPGMRGDVVQLAHEAVRAPGIPHPGGADDAEIADLQHAVGMPLPPDLVDWLRVCKGDHIGPGGLYGVRHHSNGCVGSSTRPTPTPSTTLPPSF